MWVLHFEATGNQRPIEYVVLLDEEPDDDAKEPRPGYRLATATDLDVEEAPATLPFGHELGRM